MSWIFIAIAVVFEVTVGIAAGKAQGFKKHSLDRYNSYRWCIGHLFSESSSSEL